MNDGGSAFPNDGTYANGAPEGGMSLRDYFAAQVMATAAVQARALTEKGTRKLMGIGDDESCPPVQQVTAVLAYSYADAMIEARDVQS